MHFVSANYFGLLILTLLVYWALPWRRARLAVVLVASYAFYMAWSPTLVSLLWFSTLLDYVCGGRMARLADDRRRRRWLYLSLAGNLGLLGAFKYYGFFVDSAIVLLQQLGLHPHVRTLELVLPLGISFYTFQTLSYTIDVYRRDLRAVDSLLEFAVFVAFFPQLVAGPIVRARDFLPQIVEKKRFDANDFQYGMERILIGLIKKAVIADNLAIAVDALFGNAGAPTATATNAWMAAVAFYGQIYCDFSGYSDMAIGSARLFGLRIRENFTMPYLRATPQEYWNHWHISLNSWWRDYVYYPLGGNRKGPRRTDFNLFALFAISGLWHGARWTFVLWGMMHGVHMVLYRKWKAAGHRLPRWTAWIMYVALTMFGGYLFRADSWDNLVKILSDAAALPQTMLSPMELGVLAWCALIFGLEPQGARVRRLCARPGYGPVVRGLLFGLGVLVVMLWMPEHTPDFYYFVF